ELSTDAAAQPSKSPPPKQKRDQLQDGPLDGDGEVLPAEAAPVPPVAIPPVAIPPVAIPAVTIPQIALPFQTLPAMAQVAAPIAAPEKAPQRAPQAPAQAAPRSEQQRPVGTVNARSSWMGELAFGAVLTRLD